MQRLTIIGLSALTLLIAGCAGASAAHEACGLAIRGAVEGDATALHQAEKVAEDGSRIDALLSRWLDGARRTEAQWDQMLRELGDTCRDDGFDVEGHLETVQASNTMVDTDDGSGRVAPSVQSQERVAHSPNVAPSDSDSRTADERDTPEPESVREPVSGEFKLDNETCLDILYSMVQAVHDGRVTPEELGANYGGSDVTHYVIVATNASDHFEADDAIASACAHPGIDHEALALWAAP